MELLDKCIEIKKDRGDSYGDAVESFTRIAKLWSTYTDANITPENVAMMMVLLKISRSVTREDDDDLVDSIVYMDLIKTIRDERE